MQQMMIPCHFLIENLLKTTSFKSVVIIFTNFDQNSFVGLISSVMARMQHFSVESSQNKALLTLGKLASSNTALIPSSLEAHL